MNLNKGYMRNTEKNVLFKNSVVRKTINKYRKTSSSEKFAPEPRLCLHNCI